jgi:hypothetical protein
MRRLVILAALVLFGPQLISAQEIASRPLRGRHGTPPTPAIVPPQPPATCPLAGYDTALVRYGSPNGGGNGLTIGSPFRISDFQNAAQPGMTLCLADGTYQGAASMISPPGGRSGNGGTNCGPSGAGNCGIVVMAINDGAVTIDGQFLNTPIALHEISFWTFQGFNAKSSPGSVLRFGMASLFPGSTLNNVTLKRIVLWDGSFTKNYSTVEMDAFGSNHLFEDFAVFGTGRKSFVGGSDTAGSPAGTARCRRCVFRWEGSSTAGSVALSPFYDTFGFTCENCIAIWTGESLPQAYDITDTSGNSTGVHNTNFRTASNGVNGWAAPVFNDQGSTAQNTTARCVNLNILGSMVLLPATAHIGGATGFNMDIDQLSCVNLIDVYSYIDPNQPEYPNMRGFVLEDARGFFTPDTLAANHLTSVRSAARGDTFIAPWSVSDLATGACAITGTCGSKAPNPFTVTRTTGANLCFRYVNGSLTATPLWPWPMDSRIAAATASAGSAFGPGQTCVNCSGIPTGRSTLNVTSFVENLLGTIPAQCRG